MIALEKVEEVVRLLTNWDLSQREIAKLAGVSRATVGAIAAGKRIRSAAPPGPRAVAEPAGPLVRCGGCGGLVVLPCRLCRVRAIKAEQRQAALWRRHHHAAT